MSAQVEDGHREAADRWWEEQRIFEEMAGSLAQLLADTEAAERERSAALRAEFEACVRALRDLRECSNPFFTFDERVTHKRRLAADAALFGPLAMEVRDACAADYERGDGGE